VKGRVCRECRGPMPKDPHLMRCPMCGYHNAPDVDLRKRITRLSEAKASTIVRYDVGVFNRIFGGGIATTSVNLIAGPPGAGKSTLFLTLCDMILDAYTDAKDVALFIGNEQPPDELKFYAERLGIKHADRIVILDGIGGLEFPEITSAINEFKPKLIILDSLTKLVTQAGGGDDLGVLVVSHFKELSTRLNVPSLIVNQVTKGGQHAGFNNTLHEGGALFYLDKDDVTGERLLYAEKNRFGPAPQEVHLRMIEPGLPNAGKLVLDVDWYVQNDADGEWWLPFAPVRDEKRKRHVRRAEPEVQAEIEEIDDAAEEGVDDAADGDDAADDDGESVNDTGDVDESGEPIF
jgi:predicted ATP-dependent serine protease